MVDFLEYFKNLGTLQQTSFANGSRSEVQTQPFSQEQAPITVPVGKTLMTENQKQTEKGETPFTFLQDSTKNKVKTNSVFSENSTTSSPIAETTTAADAPTSNTKNGNKKTETMAEYFTRYYTGYKKADTKTKEKFVSQYLKSMANDPTGQSKEFERLRKAGISSEELELLAKNIEVLNAKVQTNAADAVCNNGTDEQNRVGRRVVANNYQHYDKTVQNPVSQMIVKTGDTNIIKIAASHASECDKTNQVDIVGIYQKVENKDVNKILIDQYSKYAKENQLDIHTIMSGSKLSETVEYAASNIWQFDKDNQSKAVQITVNTGNEAAVNAASAQYAKYDKSVQSEIKSIIQNTDYDSAKQTLADAEEKAEAEAKQEAKIEAEEQAKAETEAKANAKAADNEKSNITEKVKNILNSKSNNKDSLIKDTLKGASEGEKIALISSLSPNELLNVLDFILQDNPSINVLSKAMTALDQIDDKRKEEFVEKINKTYLSKIVGTQIGVFSLNTQKTFVEESAKSGELNSINKNLLSTSVREKYIKLTNEQNGTK